MVYGDFKYIRFSGPISFGIMGAFGMVSFVWTLFFVSLRSLLFSNCQLFMFAFNSSWQNAFSNDESLNGAKKHCRDCEF